MYPTYILFLIIIIAPSITQAKRDFYVEKEIRCNQSGFCYDIATSAPLNGKLRQYYPSGIIKTEAEYKNGLRNGVLSRFYEDGLQQVYEVYENGILNGGASTYYNSGNIKTEIHYKNNTLNGNYKEYYEDGAIKLEGNYTFGQKHGKERSYSPSGKIINEIIYNMGTPTSAICRTQTGARINYTHELNKYLNANTTPCLQTIN